jgi:hypothetical protein
MPIIHQPVAMQTNIDRLDYAVKLSPPLPMRNDYICACKSGDDDKHKHKSKGFVLLLLWLSIFLFALTMALFIVLFRIPTAVTKKKKKKWVKVFLCSSKVLRPLIKRSDSHVACAEWDRRISLEKKLFWVTRVGLIPKFVGVGTWTPTCRKIMRPWPAWSKGCFCHNFKGNVNESLNDTWKTRLEVNKQVILPEQKGPSSKPGTF